MKNRIRSLVVSIIFLLAASPISHAQQWSDQEQELLDYIEMCWEAWMEGVKKNDPDIFFNKAKPIENFSMWWTELGSPEGERAVRRNWGTFVRADIDWIDIRPVAIRIYDNVGMVQFYGYWKANSEAGPVTTEYKRTEVFIKRNGRWAFFGGQGSPVSAKDADPYK